jgi:hypothetical protein
MDCAVIGLVWIYFGSNIECSKIKNFNNIRTAESGDYGTEIEGNPLMRWYFENDIAWAVKIYGVGALMAVVGICINKKPRTAWAAWVLLVVYSAIALYHLALVFITNSF